MWYIEIEKADRNIYYFEMISNKTRNATSVLNPVLVECFISWKMRVTVNVFFKVFWGHVYALIKDSTEITEYLERERCNPSQTWTRNIAVHDSLNP